jgi:hypothetical protein
MAQGSVVGLWLVLLIILVNLYLLVLLFINHINVTFQNFILTNLG